MINPFPKKLQLTPNSIGLFVFLFYRWVKSISYFLNITSYILVDVDNN